ncbi:YitT family protein [Ammoniphilus resinae]|uniref:Uncharacterized membrane-anchored protein YitT (DUF2179 family) n=1 Tax=Ammoniphilus resinae TaxID=861532 RepID=A0ABS4GSW2_9BACL|nr:YitT family protein [Ammoniphilus resinae]MBP1933377.1 uncharacterized membrane-anchored protein YitT (DUF2179 family) [Ammoniphilus resinae]
MKNQGKLRMVIEIFGVIFGSLLFSLGSNTLLIPSNLLAGGITGVCMLFYHIFGWSVGTQYFLYNIPLLILGYIHLGRKFIIYTILAVSSDTMFLHLLPIRLMWTDNIILNSIFGAVATGVGGALMLRAGGSNGGLDVLGRVIAKHRNISIAKFGLIVNVVIVAVSAVFFDVQSAMFTVLSIYVGAKTYESLLNIAERSSVIIVTDKGREVSEALNHSLHRGVTSWEALGAYSNAEKKVILCIIVNIQWSELYETVHRIDPQAFITALPAHKVVGNFKNTW